MSDREVEEVEEIEPVDASQEIADKMLRGWTMLADYCPRCYTPLMRNRQRKTYCAPTGSSTAEVAGIVSATVLRKMQEVADLLAHTPAVDVESCHRYLACIAECAQIVQQLQRAMPP
ncbi:hypothetical protein WJX72_004568 [[Myrmecia] bisecta]|uniref:Uncharacterized protein n=1 Tax=[Myrmecia] bisecta TaxID=41462 RepID=A0AAW1Q3G0_9CHLO